jgi:hypothetical protein
LLQQQILQQQLGMGITPPKSIFNDLPQHILSTLDNMALGIAKEENTDTLTVKQRLITNINKLAPADLEYLKSEISMLVEKAVHENEEINDETVDKKFITFLIRLFY